MPDKAHPVVFIHGLWLHPSSWGPWESLFGQSGYRVLSPGWPGDQETVELARANPDSVTDQGIDDVVEHLEVAGATDSEAAALGVAVGAPLLAISRTSSTADGRVFEWSYDLFRSDRTRVTFRTRAERAEIVSISTVA